MLRDRAEAPKPTELMPFIGKEATQVLVLSEEEGKVFEEAAASLKCLRKPFPGRILKMHGWSERERILIYV